MHLEKYFSKNLRELKKVYLCSGVRDYLWLSILRIRRILGWRFLCQLSVLKHLSAPISFVNPQFGYLHPGFHLTNQGTKHVTICKIAFFNNYSIRLMKTSITHVWEVCLWIHIGKPFVLIPNTGHYQIRTLSIVWCSAQGAEYGIVKRVPVSYVRLGTMPEAWDVPTGAINTIRAR